MPTNVVMPEMGESVTEGTITRWLVEVGDRVEKDQPIVEVSTDKVDAEIPSPTGGVVLELRFDVDEVVEVDSVLAVVGDDEEATAAASTAGAAAAPSRRPEEEPSGSAPARPAEEAKETLQRVLATPVARKIAQEQGVDLSQIAGSGVRGRITKKDVLEAVEAQDAAATPAPPAEAAPRPAPQAEGFSVPAWVEGERVEIEPMSRMRKLTARHMSYSEATSVHVTTVFHIDMSSVVAVRERAREAFAAKHGTKLTYMPFIFRAVISALEAHPKFNASVDGERIVYKQDVNLGMAVALERGLIVPVIHDADQLSLVGLAERANDLAERARSKRLKPEEVRRGTFTVTNPGVFGSLFGTPIINQPQVAILCVGAIEKRPVVVTDAMGRDAIAIRHMAYFALTYDHRLIDGADAELFMQDVERTLVEESWSELAAYGTSAER